MGEVSGGGCLTVPWKQSEHERSKWGKRQPEERNELAFRGQTRGCVCWGGRRGGDRGRGEYKVREGQIAEVSKVYEMFWAVPVRG